MVDSSTGGLLAPSGPPGPAPVEDDKLTDILQELVAGITGLAGTLVRPRWQPRPDPLPAYNVNWVGMGISDRQSDAFPSVQHEYYQAGYLVCGVQVQPAAPAAPYGAFQAIAKGGFKIALAGGATVEVDNVSLTLIQNLYQVALIVTTAMGAAGLQANCTYQNGQFIFYSAYGSVPSVSFLSAPAGVGQFDLSALLLGTAALGAIQSSGSFTDDRQKVNEELTLFCSFYGPNADMYAALLRDGLQIPQNREPLYPAGVVYVGHEQNVVTAEQINEQWYYRVDQRFVFRRHYERVYAILNIASATATITTDTGYTKIVAATLGP